MRLPSRGFQQAQPPVEADQNVEQTNAPVEIENVEDISLAPTQILTPQQMIAYQTRRWQHELERERASSTWSGPSGYDVGEKTEAAGM